MKYAIYDKAADGYLTKMVFDVGYSNDTQFSCALNEYITNAELLDTKKAATDAVARIEVFKFMEKGRFVIHSFDDTLNDQYIISEAGNPTKVVDNITVDLDGNVNVKYGTMACHWSTISLNDAIDRMNALQKAVSAIYTPWSDTFMVYEVITIMDEKEHTHYQFINRTITGLTKAEHDEEEKLLVAGKEITDITYPLNKRIEELEKANYELGERAVERGSVANRLFDENNSLKAKVEVIKKEAHDWKKLYEKANKDREILTNVIDNIYDDLDSTDICKGLRETYDYVKGLSELNYINIHNDNTDNGEPIYITAAVEFKFIISKIIDAIESYEGKVQNYIDANLSIWKKNWVDKVKESNELRVARDCLAEIIRVIRNAIVGGDVDAIDCIKSRMKHDSDFNSNPFMAGVRENIKDVCDFEKITITDNDLLTNEIARLAKEKDKALERAEFYKRQANSVYGMAIPTRCCGKQLMADILNGKKIPVDKKKYDDLVESINNLTK